MNSRSTCIVLHALFSDVVVDRVDVPLRVFCICGDGLQRRSMSLCARTLRSVNGTLPVSFSKLGGVGRRKPGQVVPLPSLYLLVWKLWGFPTDFVLVEGRELPQPRRLTSAGNCRETGFGLPRSRHLEHL